MGERKSVGVGKFRGVAPWLGWFGLALQLAWIAVSALGVVYVQSLTQGILGWGTEPVLWGTFVVLVLVLHRGVQTRNKVLMGLSSLYIVPGILGIVEIVVHELS